MIQKINYPFEVNDTFSYAYETSSGRTIHATIHNPDDVDYYEFYVDDSSEIDIELYNIPGDCDYDLELYNSSRTRIARSANGGDDDEDISTTLDEGWYYILVKPYNNSYSSSDYYALWLRISPLVAQFQVKHYYDEGYSTRFLNVSTAINNYQNTVNSILETVFDVEVSSSRSSYTSYADDCKIEEYGNVYTENLAEECEHTENHLYRDELEMEFTSDKGEGSNVVTKVLWTGHILDGNAPSASYSSDHTVIITPRYTTDINTYENLGDIKIVLESEYTLLHELSHQLGAHDHYCYRDNGSAHCSNPYCARCDSSAIPFCLMSSRFDDVSSISPHSLYCDECEEIITQHIDDHH